MRGAKRSRTAEYYDENDNLEHSFKRARVSGYEKGGEDDEEEEEEEEEEDWESGDEESGDEGSGDEESGDEESGDEESGDEKGVDTRGSSKEDAIDLVDSGSETEAIAPKIAAPIIRSGPFLEGSDDEGYAETQRVLLGMLHPSCHVSIGQDAQATSSVGRKEFPDFYESEVEFDGEETLVAGGDGVKRLEE